MYKPALHDGPHEPLSTNSYYKYDKSAGTTSVVDEYDHKVETQYTFTKGEAIKDFHARKKRGELLPFTRFHQYYREGRITRGVFDYTISSSGDRYYWSPLWVKSYGWILDESQLTKYLDPRVYAAQDIHVQEAAAKLNSGWDLLTFAAEFRKTLGMVTQAISRLVWILKHRNPEQLFVEGQYGWRILIYDIQDIQEALEKLGKESKKVRRKKVRFSQYSFQEIETQHLQYTHVSYDLTTEKEYTISTRGTIVGDIVPPVINLNPLLTAWELITLSFVVDWFLGVGTWLQSLAFTTFTSDYKAAGGVKIACKCRVYTSNTTFADATGTVEFDSIGYAELVNRRPMTVPYHPLFVNDFDLAKLRDVLAILRAVLKKR